MNDLEERILDRLVGTRIGVNWPDGLLAIAADVVGGKQPVLFGLTRMDLNAKTEIARRLGYPILLCEAIQGASSGLDDQHDRRRLAVSLLGSVPIGRKLAKLSVRAQNRIAAQIAIRAHRYLCLLPDCPVVSLLGELLTPDFTMGRPRRDAYETRCGSIDAGVGHPFSKRITVESPRKQRVMHTVALAIHGFQIRKCDPGWESLRESARLAASERGVDEAVACCREIARLCGLAPRGA